MAEDAQMSQETIRSKILDVYLSREMADRASLLQFQLSFQRSLLFLNGLGATAVIGLFQSKLSPLTPKELTDLVLIFASLSFLLGARQAMLLASTISQSRLRFMFVWGGKMTDCICGWQAKDGAAPLVLANDPGDTGERKRSVESHLELALEHSEAALRQIKSSSSWFLFGVVLTVLWSLAQFFDAERLFKAFGH